MSPPGRPAVFTPDLTTRLSTFLRQNALIAVLAVQVGTGLVADDEIATTGPLIRFVSGEASLAWTGHGGGE